MGLNETNILKHFFAALEEGYIQPYFQPVYRSVTEKIFDAEALARWEDPNLGMLSPADFVPVLEQHGLIYELDLAILRHTCRFYAQLREYGKPVHSFSVNLSRHDFGEPDLFERVTGILQEFDVPSEAIRLEVTESVMLTDVDDFERYFRLFHDAGFSIWVDDFGSGYSSLNLLQNYEFDTLKFDLLFLKNFSDRSRQVLAAMINMAKMLGIHTVSEGVETEEQQKFLLSVGCEGLQGYYYARPVSKDAFWHMLDENPECREDPEEKTYWDQIGRFNFLSTFPLEDFGVRHAAGEAADTAFLDHGEPLALLECSSDQAFYAFASNAYLMRLRQLGYSSLQVLEQAFNDKVSDQYLIMKRLVLNAISHDSIQEVDYINNDVYYKIRARCLAKTDRKAMLALQLRTFNSDREVRTASEMLNYGNALFNTYELVTVIYPEKDSSERIYSRESIKSYASAGFLRDSFRRFCQREVVPADRDRYLRFCDLETLEKRLAKGFIQDNFRLVSSGEWRSIRISRIPSDRGRAYLYTIQAIPEREKMIFDTYAEEHPEGMA